MALVLATLARVAPVHATAVTTVGAPNGRIAYTNNGLWTADSDGRNPRKLVAGSGNPDLQPFGPRWSHDGTRIAFMLSWQIWVVGADGTGAHQLTFGATRKSGPTWSPDDRRILYADIDLHGIMSVDAEGNNGLYVYPGGIGPAEYSPDGTRIALIRPTANYGLELAVVRTDGTVVAEVSTGTSSASWSNPRWSPDGTQILFTENDSILDPFKFGVVNADGSGRRILAAADDIADAWSPDGSRIVFHSSTDATVSTMRPDGSDIRPLGLVSSAVDWQPATRAVLSMAAGAVHNLALRVDGTVAAWGFNAFGELGDGTTVDRSTPVPVQGLPPAAAVSGGFFHSLAAGVDGRVWAWGYNGEGQLGDGTLTDSALPRVVAGLSGVTSVAAGMAHSLAVKTDGTVWAWGWNGYGQLGDGTTVDRTRPVQVSGLTSVISVAAGVTHSLALKSDGTVWAWGYNGQGELGGGSTVGSAVPVRIGTLPPIVAVAAGAFHSVAAASDGSVWTWGWNALGQLGDGTTADSWVPRRVPGVNARSVAAGAVHTVAGGIAGQPVWAWGYNGQGQLGTGSHDDSTTPVPVPGLDAYSVAAGWAHTLSVDQLWRPWAWGFNGQGELGNGSVVDGALPVPVSTL